MLLMQHNILTSVTGSSVESVYVYRDSTPTWARSTTTATVTANRHNLANGATVNVTTSSDVAAITVSAKTITVTGTNTFTFACLDAGATSGTLTMTEYAQPFRLIAHLDAAVTPNGGDVVISWSNTANRIFKL